MRVSLKRSWFSHCSSSLNWGCWVTEAPRSPRRRVAPRPASTAGISPSSREGVRPEAEKRLKLLAKRLKPKGIELRPESYGWSVIQALLSRSDRRLAPVIAAVRGKSDSQGSWKRAYKELKQDLPPWEEVIHARWDEQRVLPWSHLEGPLPVATLAKHRAEALSLGPEA